MLRYLLQNPLQRAVMRAGAGPFAPVLVGFLALLLTATMSIPVTAVVVPAALISRARWKAIAALSALGSAIGATLLVGVFHQWGWDQIYAAFPGMLASPPWLRVIDWVSRWGTLGLFAVAALPLPQTPALIFFALGRYNPVEILLAMLAGKILKYGCVAGAVAIFPEKFSRLMGPNHQNTGRN